MTAIVISPIKRALLSALKSEIDSSITDEIIVSDFSNYKTRFTKEIPLWFHSEHPSHQSLMIRACIDLGEPIWYLKPNSEWVYACSGAISLDDF